MNDTAIIFLFLAAILLIVGLLWYLLYFQESKKVKRMSDSDFLNYLSTKVQEEKDRYDQMAPLIKPVSDSFLDQAASLKQRMLQFNEAVYEPFESDDNPQSLIKAARANEIDRIFEQLSPKDEKSLNLLIEWQSTREDAPVLAWLLTDQVRDLAREFNLILTPSPKYWATTVTKLKDSGIKTSVDHYGRKFDLISFLEESPQQHPKEIRDVLEILSVSPQKDGTITLAEMVERKNLIEQLDSMLED